jgi:anti-sigma B factor antagonist
LRGGLGFQAEVAPLAFTSALTSAGDALISLTGELDLSGAGPLEEEIVRLLEADGVSRIVLDLRELEFMDSSGLRMVALTERRLRGSARQLVLVRGRDAVQRVFAITRMDAHLTFVDHPDELPAADTIDVELESTPAAPARARGALDGLEGRIQPERMRDVRLLVSELVTNAVRHAEGEAVRLVVAVTGTLLRIEVHDPGRGFELKPPPDDPLRASGWGLVLVEELADRWGIDHHPRTRVWFEMD